MQYPSLDFVLYKEEENVFEEGTFDSSDGTQVLLLNERETILNPFSTPYKSVLIKNPNYEKCRNDTQIK